MSAPLSTLPITQGGSIITDLITETMVRLDQTPWAAPITAAAGFADKRILVVGREQLSKAVSGVVTKLGACVERIGVEELETKRPDVSRDVLILDGHCWEHGAMPSHLLTRWQRAKKPFIVILTPSQRSERANWLEAGALDVFLSPPPIRRLVTRLVEAATGRRTPMPRRTWPAEATATVLGKTERAQILELSPEDLLLSTALSLLPGRVAEITFTPTEGTTITVFARSIFCRSYVSNRAVESGRVPPYVAGLRILGVSREEGALLDRLGTPGGFFRPVTSSKTMQFK